MMEMITAQGMRMPKLGLGTWPMKGRECQQAIESALALGYRHVDTAQSYGNEDAVGAALAATQLPRSEIHVTTKVWHDHLAPDAMRRAMEASLRALRTDYVDLYLIHWPSPSMNLARSLEALVRLKEEGRAKAIGVSNFPAALLRQAVEEWHAPIACNQVEYHVLLDQSRIVGYAQSHGFAVTAYSPLAKGSELARLPELQRIAAKHHATPAQVALKWLLDQDGVAAVPKSASPERQKENLGALKLQLDDEDREEIARLPKNRRLISPSWAPQWD
jgi:2,5-diketo-D-gluconate reductase B